MSDLFHDCNKNSKSPKTHYDNLQESIVCNQIGELYDHDIYYQISKIYIFQEMKKLIDNLSSFCCKSKEEQIEGEEDEENELMNENEEEKILEENFEKIIVGVCAMAKKVNSKPMEAILTRLKSYDHFEIIVFPQETILDEPIEQWPRCDCFLSFYSKDFPLKKAQEYAKHFNPYLINDLEKQWDIMDRTKVYQMLQDAGIEQPTYAIKRQDDDIQIIEQEDQIEINGQIFTKPFVEKPINADDHNIYIYFPSSAGGGSQRLFRKTGTKSSIYSHEMRIRRKGSYIYETFMPTDGTDVKIYTVGPEYAHAEARKSPALDGVVERDENGKEVRYPVMLRAEEKIIAKKIVLAFKQAVCGFDLLRANGKSYVCDVNGFSFVKNSTKYYDDCSSILAHSILKEIAPQRHIPYLPISYQAEDRPIVPTTFGTMMELRCVIGVMRHGDRTPKQKMKMEIRNKLFMDLFNKYDGMKNGNLKLKRPSQLQEVLDIARKLYKECVDLNKETLSSQETKTKLLQLKSVLEMYGHFSGINRKVQFKYQAKGKQNSSSEDDQDGADHVEKPYLLLILKWGGELTKVGKVQAEELGTAFRKLYPGSEGSKDTGFLRLHSTYRHDLKIYASDEGRVQTTAAAFAKGLLALDGELAPIMVQMVKSANTNGLLDNESMSAKLQVEAKAHLSDFLTQDKELDEMDKGKINPANNYSLRSTLDFIRNPVDMCKSVYGYVKELNNLIRNKITDNKYYDMKLYHDESWELMLRRWSKLEKDFFNKKLGKFEISKIPDIYDSVKYDLMHNRNILNFENAYNLYTCTKALADVVIPQEYGITREEKLSIAQGIVTPLLKKIRADLKCNLTGIWESDQDIYNDQTANKLDPSYSRDIHTPGRHVRTRLYFTSESHIYSLLTVLKYGNLFEDENDEQWKTAISFLNRIPELNYLTQIVIMLYEDPNVEPNSDKRFHVELHFSSGAYADFDAPAYLIKAQPVKMNSSQNEHHSDDQSSGNESRDKSSPVQSSSPCAKYKIINNYLNRATDKRFPLKNFTKRFPAKKNFKELQPLPEPNISLPVDYSNNNEESNPNDINHDLLKVNVELKPRSFDDETRRMNSIKKSYNHYNTFHGSGSLNDYISLSQIFKTKHLNTGTNSSPDLNQNLLVKKKSVPTIYQELIKVRYMRPLETLHNNLCFKNLNNFLTRMIYNKQKPNQQLSSNSCVYESIMYSKQFSNDSLKALTSNLCPKEDTTKNKTEIKNENEI